MKNIKYFGIVLLVMMLFSGCSESSEVTSVINGTFEITNPINQTLNATICDLDGECATVSNNKLDVQLNDQTTPILIFPVYRVLQEGFALANNTITDTRNITLTNSSGFIVGDTIGIFQDSTNVRNYFGEVLAINGNELTLDKEFESVFDISLNPIIQKIDMNINEDASTNRIIYEFRNYGSVPLDIVRVLFTMETTNSVDLNKFGDISGGLNVGCLLREQKADGTYANIYNFKTNFDFLSTQFDLNTFAATHPQQGINGLGARLTFGSAGKLGVVVRLAFNESFQFVCHDNLSPLVKFIVTPEGSLTDEPINGGP